MNMEVYTCFDFKTKKALREAVAEANVPVYDTEGGAGIMPVEIGSACVCGPHYPKPHSWYASVTISQNENDGFIIAKGSKVK